MKNATRAAILEGAEAVFAERGYHGARMEEIASRAGLAVGTLYNYFDDRQALLAALLDAAGEQLDVALTEALRGRHPSFRERLEVFLRAAVRHIDAHWRLFAILIEDELASGRGGSGGSGRRPMLREVYAAAERLVALGVREGALREAGSELFPALLVGSVRGVFTRQLYVRRGAPVEERVLELVDFFLEGAGSRR